MFDHTPVPDTVLIIHPVFSSRSHNSDRDVDEVLLEAEGLARAIELEVLDLHKANISRMTPGYLFGKGTREIIAEKIEALEPNVVFINYTLSPIQQRNLEKEWNAKVMDRTGLILEIFGARAQTKEGSIQVDLARLEYERSRLVRTWTHLERQRGGTSTVGGAGESQLELDRRIIAERIASLKKDLIKVRKTRELGRKSRERVPFPIVALVGYTNAGKSTLFNRLTGASVFAEDLPFATLDPTLRRIELPSGREVILSDTVGFIADLPTDLVEAFRATLEQTEYADVILHIRDSTQKDFEMHRKDVIRILHDLGINYETDERIFEVINKIDMCEEDRKDSVLRDSSFDPSIIPVSAITGEGVDQLLEKIDALLAESYVERRFDIPVSDGKAIAWLYEHANVLKAEEKKDFMSVFVHIDAANQNRFEGLFHYAAH